MALHLQVKLCGGFASKGHFGAIHAKDARIAARCASSCGYAHAREKSQFHQPRRKVGWQIDVLNDARFTLAKVRKPAGRR